MDITLTDVQQVVEYGSLRAYRYPALAGATHAVFTRRGGVSPPPWNGLNMGLSVGDAPENVTANVALACRALGIDPAATASCKLVHGNRVVVARQSREPQFLEQADAIISAAPGVFLTMRFGDCVPLLFFDPANGVVGLAHAGWRGTVKNVTGAVAAAMKRRFGSKPANIRLVIGPSIGPCCYRVQRDVLRAAQQTFDAPDAFFQRRNGDMYFDMWRANAHQARQAGLGAVTQSNLCTACRTGEFFSHRAEGGKTGRFGVFVGLPAAGAPRR
ncbi:MAG: peptidoglycan editing factor PgeF [Anaerolineae bacterium]